MLMQFTSEQAWEVPRIPYPHNKQTCPAMQRLHWVMCRLSDADRPTIVPMIRKLDNRECEGYRFIMAVPTADANHELVYYTVGDVTAEFLRALQAVQQGELL